MTGAPVEVLLIKDRLAGYTTNLIDISGPIIVPVNGDTATNYLDVGAGTNFPSRYHRVRLVP